MITKEELLQKGVPEETADEIIAAFDENSQEDNSLQALSKALDDDPENQDDLFKADKGEKDDKKDEKDEDYNEDYMKKHMVRYMKTNKKSCRKMMKEVDDSKEDMNKAINDIDLDTEGAVVEMADLAPFLDSQKAFNETMVKALSDISEKVELVSEKSEKSYDLMYKAAKVQVEQATGMEKFLATPEGRKGVVASKEMAKASTGNGAKFSAEDNKVIYSTLMKAVKNGEKDAGTIISVFESRGKDANRLNNVQKEFLHDLISKKEDK